MSTIIVKSAMKNTAIVGGGGAVEMERPPPTMAVFFMADLTIMKESWMDLSASSMNCWAPPRMMSVAALLLVQFSNRFHRSAPICCSWNSPHVPRIDSASPAVTVVCTTAPGGGCFVWEGFLESTIIVVMESDGGGKRLCETRNFCVLVVQY